MPQSLSNVLVHVAFSTKDRAPVLSKGVREELFPYVGAVLGQEGAPCVLAGGHDDHLHLLFQLSRSKSLAATVGSVKANSSRWLKTKGGLLEGFSWQGGYSAFSVNAADSRGVESYIRNQEEHHRSRTFQEEMRELYREFKIDFDERYVWD